jgi:signal transduction histidine kinase
MHDAIAAPLDAAVPPPVAADPPALARRDGFEAVMRGHDWASTPLGPMERWPASLRTAAGICAHAPQPMLLAWGEALGVLFNEAFHSQHGALTLGQPLAAHAPGKVEAFRTVLVTGQALDHEGNVLIPISDERGATGGVLMMPHAQSGIAKAIGHELRNPLATILTAAQLLERRAGADERLIDPARRIVASTERMAHMLDLLVGYMRLQAAGLSFRPAPVDVTALTRDAVDSVRAHALQWKVTFEAVGDGHASVDAEGLRQVVLNLARNAATHASSAPCRVQVDAANPAYVALSVENDGELPAGLKPFEAFEGLGPARGVGLGLYVARALVEAHGGTVTAHSKAGLTRFTVLLPRTPPASPAA